ncbi:MAG TPA: PASTA domain-containing protein [Solirubrobacteraceae bacterium]|jgi:hypothetical protein|nr:PASTA domain-containing protein [Solirubrobacteraceae bacterium]
MSAPFGVIDDARRRQQRRRRLFLAAGVAGVAGALGIVIASGGSTPRPVRRTPVASRPASSQIGGHQQGQVICLVDAAEQARTKQQRTAITHEINDLKHVRSCGTAAELLRLNQILRASKAVPDIVGQRLDDAEAKLRAADLVHYGIGYGGPPLTQGHGPAKDWIVCGTSPAPGALLTPPRLGLWLIARKACIHSRPARTEPARPDNARSH